MSNYIDFLTENFTIHFYTLMIISGVKCYITGLFIMSLICLYISVYLCVYIPVKNIIKTIV